MERLPTSDILVGTGAAGGSVVSDAALLGATLTFAGTYVSDDATLVITTSSTTTAHPAARFIGYCDSCPPPGGTRPEGEPLADIPAAVLFAEVHRHGDDD